MPPKQQPTYEKDQEVLCLHGESHYYAARIIDIQKDEKTGDNVYRVHYKGWNVRYDEDIVQGDTKKRFLEHTPENVEMAAKAIKEARMKAKAKKRSTMETATNKAVKRGQTDSRQSTPIDRSRGHSAESDASSKVGSTKRLTGRKVTSEVMKKGVPARTKPVAKSTTSTPTSSRKRRPTDNVSVDGKHRADSEAPSEELGDPAFGAKDDKDRSLEITNVLREAREKEARSPVAGRKIKFDLPYELKMYLLDGDDIIKRLNMLPQLPAKNTVESIIDKYIAEELGPRSETESSKLTDTHMKHVCAGGMKECFNAVLGKILLYKFERPQYSDLHDKERKASTANFKSDEAGQEEEKPKRRTNKQNVDPNSESFVPNVAKYYGFMHLLRMLVSFETVVNHIDWPKSCLGQIDIFLEDFGRFLVKNKDKFCDIKNDFAPAQSEYHRRAWNAGD
uniref:MRG domain-containing protein n=1 Tax=Steinernema glaseri TaxID=37863 RepID=A0A1I7ZJT5_9BILA